MKHIKEIIEEKIFEKKLVIAFDVDDTLIIPAMVAGTNVDVPNYETIAIYDWFKSQGHFMIVWSGGGVDYARMWANKLGLKPDAVIKKEKDGAIKVDIAFDDCDVDLADVNVKVKRRFNFLSRKEWNKHEDTKDWSAGDTGMTETFGTSTEATK